MLLSYATRIFPIKPQTGITDVINMYILSLLTECSALDESNHILTKVKLKVTRVFYLSQST